MNLPRWVFIKVPVPVLIWISSEYRECLPSQTDTSGNSSKRIKLNEKAVQTDQQLPCTTLQPVFPMTCLQLRPKKCVDSSLEAWPNRSEFVKEVTDIEGMVETLENLKKCCSEWRTIDRQHEYPRVVFLGTGSCIPNKTRNVSSILIHTR